LGRDVERLQRAARAGVQPRRAAGVAVRARRGAPAGVRADQRDQPGVRPRGLARQVLDPDLDALAGVAALDVQESTCLFGHAVALGREAVEVDGQDIAGAHGLSSSIMPSPASTLLKYSGKVLATQPGSRIATLPARLKAIAMRWSR